MGVEPTTSRVRFQIRARQQQDTTRNVSQIRTYVAECRCLFGYFVRTTTLVHGQKADNLELVIANETNALLMSHLRVCSNHRLHKYFSTAVRELSVSFLQGDGNGKEFTMPFMWA